MSHELTEDMLERGAAELWAMSYEVELSTPKPWDELSDAAKEHMRKEVRQLWKAIHGKSSVLLS